MVIIQVLLYDTYFLVPGVTKGLFCVTPSVALTRALNNQKLAMHMLLTGETITAQGTFQLSITFGDLFPSVIFFSCIMRISTVKERVS